MVHMHYIAQPLDHIHTMSRGRGPAETIRKAPEDPPAAPVRTTTDLRARNGQPSPRFQRRRVRVGVTDNGSYPLLLDLERSENQPVSCNCFTSFGPEAVKENSAE